MTTDVEVLPAVAASCCGLQRAGTPTLEEFTIMCEAALGKTLKPRLCINVKDVPDYQQWFAAIKAAYYIGYLKRNVQVIAPTGQGKTYFIAGKLVILQEFWPERFDGLQAGLMKGKMPWVIIQPAKVVMQCRQILASFGLHHVIVTTLASLRASLGENCIDYKTIIVGGQPTLYPFWKMEMAPLGIDVDESQQLKNDSQQTDIILSAAFSGIPVVPLSATPFSRLCQARAISLILSPRIGGTDEHPIYLSTKLWPSFVRELCPKGVVPEEWSPQGIRNIRQYLEPQTIRWSIPYPHPVRTKLVSCKFKTVESRQRYDDAFAWWQEMRIRKGKNILTDLAALLVAIAKFNQVAEEERVDSVVEYAVDYWLSRESTAKKCSIILGFVYRTSADKALIRLKQILGEAEFKKRVAVILGGIDCSADHALFQKDIKQILVMTIACGGAGLSLDQNKSNKRQRYMFSSASWNDILMAQFAGRTQRLLTESCSYLFIFYFEGTEEVSKIKKMRRKISSLKEIVTETVITNNNDNAGGGIFTSDIDDVEHVRDNRLLSDIKETEEIPISDEDMEELVANDIIGTTNQVEIILDE